MHLLYVQVIIPPSAWGVARKRLTSGDPVMIATVVNLPEPVVMYAFRTGSKRPMEGGMRRRLPVW